MSAGEIVDALVVGSGASAVHAAWPLVEAGLSVRMLDVGHRDDAYAPLVPDLPFREARASDARQHRWILGDAFEGIDLRGTGPGAQLTPPRQFVAREAQARTPVESTTFFPIESLAAGGLAGAWGAGCPPFDDADLADLPIGTRDLAPHYERVAARIGVSGPQGDLAPLVAPLDALQPPLAVDANARALLRSYERRRAGLARAGFRLGRPRLALLSEPLGEREACRYHDMEFWSDAGRSVYRPRWTLDELERRPRFELRAGSFVERFVERADGTVEVVARVAGGGEERHHARALVLGAGALGTARIVLRSLDLYGTRVPLVCNPHTYAPLLNLAMLGRAAVEPCHSLAQLCFAQTDAEAGITLGHVYSYGSLLLFRLVKDSPLAARESLRAFRLLRTALTILIVQHADAPSERKACALVRGTGGAPDRLAIDYALESDDERRIDRIERAILRAFRRLACVALGRVRPGHAASIHYAGTFPHSAEPRERTCDPYGLLRGTRAVHLVDGSTFASLPSKGLTFTMMANADRIGCALARRLSS